MNSKIFVKNGNGQDGEYLIIYKMGKIYIGHHQIADLKRYHKIIYFLKWKVMKIIILL